MSSYKRAERKKLKARVALCGPGGSGKTWSALLLAKGLGGRIALVDTEHNSAELYAHVCEFDVARLLPPYTPTRYLALMKEAVADGYDTIIVDSFTHVWSGEGGLLEMNDMAAKAKFKGNSYMAWSDTTPKYRRLIENMLALPAHVITTIRSKTLYGETEVGGKKSYVKLGAGPEQRSGIDYEYTVFLDLDMNNIAIASKNRTSLMKDPFVISEETGEELREWLDGGTAIDVLLQSPCRMSWEIAPIAELGMLATKAVATLDIADDPRGLLIECCRKAGGFTVENLAKSAATLLGMDVCLDTMNYSEFAELLREVAFVHACQTLEG